MEDTVVGSSTGKFGFEMTVMGIKVNVGRGSGVPPASGASVAVEDADTVVCQSAGSVIVEEEATIVGGRVLAGVRLSVGAKVSVVAADGFRVGVGVGWIVTDGEIVAVAVITGAVAVSC